MSLATAYRIRNLRMAFVIATFSIADRTKASPAKIPAFVYDNDNTWINSSVSSTLVRPVGRLCKAPERLESTPRDC